MKKSKVLLAVVLFVVFGSFVYATSGQAALVTNPTGVHYSDVASTDWWGQLTWSTGIYATNDGGTPPKGWDNAGTSLTWNISQVGNLYNYSYTWNTSAKDLSHIILEVSGTATAADFIGTRAEDPKWYYPTTGGTNPSMPGDIFGIKFEASGVMSYTLSFDSYRAPMWGNFYAKDGNDGPVYAYNTGWTSATSPSYFAAVPDTKSAVPVPPSVWLLGSGLIGLVGLRRRFFRK